MEKETYLELVNEVDKRTTSVFEKLNQSLENPSDLNLRVDAIEELVLNIQANKQMIELVQKLIEDNEKSNLKLFKKLKNLYYLVKMNNYYCATNEELLSTACEHGFAKRGEK